MSTSLDFKARKLVQRGTRSAQPLATLVAEGTIYFVTDETVLERSTGSAWEAVSHAKGQIAFPATQNPSSDPNTLDDYERGSWTPAYSGSGGQSGQVYVAQTGKYVKVGRMVQYQCRIILSTLGTITGTVRVSGLPFSTETANFTHSAATVGYWGDAGAALDNVSALVAPNSVLVELYFTSAAATVVSSFSSAQMSNTFDIILSGVYTAAA